MPSPHNIIAIPKTPMGELQQLQSEEPIDLSSPPIAPKINYNKLYTTTTRHLNSK